MAGPAPGGGGKGQGIHERSLNRRSVRRAHASRVQPRIHPVEAVRIINDNILRHFEAVTIGKKDYIEALTVVGNGGWSGAKIYDALLMGCAARCGADRIYTFDLADFRLLAPAGLQEKVCTPWNRNAWIRAVSILDDYVEFDALASPREISSRVRS